jgi:iron complex outermembrane receptor protein
MKLSSSTTLSYELEYVHQEAPFDRGIVAPGAVLGVVPNSRFLGEPNDGPMTIKGTGHQLVLQQTLAGDWSLLVGAGYRDSSFEGFSSEAELAASRQTLGRAATPTLLSRQRRFRNYDATDQSARAELTGRFETGFLTHHLLLGADWYHYKLDLVQNRFRPSLAVPYGIDILNPVYGQAAPTPLPFTSSLEQQHAEGFYVQDQIDLTEQWKMLAGVRYDQFRQELADRITNKTSRQSPTATSPRVGLVYQFVPSASVYASFSKGFRPNSGQDISGTAFVPEKSRSYEIGTKFDLLDGKISSTLALYKSHKSNILTSDPINAGFSIAAGEAESKGVEFDAAGKITEDLRATISYAYTDAKVTKASLDVNFGNLLPVGARLINIPRNSASLLVIQDFHVSTSVIGLGGGVNYVSKRLGETGVPNFQLPSYTLVRLMGYYQPTEHLKFSVDVDNLFDRTYYPSSYARYWVGAGAPRSYSARAEYRF